MWFYELPFQIFFSVRYYTNKKKRGYVWFIGTYIKIVVLGCDDQKLFPLVCRLTSPDWERDEIMISSTKVKA